ncbi:MAG: hypothetical protein JSV45_10345 [Chromatiales bacterium]|nr:MAG: hypothetical protein JSV45_10345 [Chromatiales bacterium]
MIVEDVNLGILLSLLGVVTLSLVHLFVYRFRFLQQEAGPWISASAGVAIAYVFVDVLPLLASQQARLTAEDATGWLRFLKHHAYLVAMAGFAFHYAIALSRDARSNPDAAGSLIGGALMPKFSLISLLIYAFLIGYLIGEKWDHDGQPGLLFALAMAVHFIGLNHLAYEEAPSIYIRWLRFQLAAVTLIGWLLGILTRVSDAVFFLSFSFLAGGIIVVAMAVELPRIRARTRDFLAFNGGMLGFSGLLLIAEYVRELG